MKGKRFYVYQFISMTSIVLLMVTMAGDWFFREHYRILDLILMVGMAGMMYSIYNNNVSNEDEKKRRFIMRNDLNLIFIAVILRMMAYRGMLGQ